MSRVVEVDFLEFARKKYKRYGRHALGFRHFAEFRDGLKPVQRRAAWTLHNELSANRREQMMSSSRVCGDTAGRYHPHEMDSIYGALIGLSQAETRAPIVLGVGNYGNWLDKPAAHRYTYCYLSAYGNTFFDKDEVACIPFESSFDGKSREPRFLPARLPHLLLSGIWSMAPGVSGNIPPCTPDWVLESIDASLRKKHLSLPKEFAYRWGGRLLSLDKSWLTTPHASASFAPTVRVDKAARAVVITSLAPGFSLTALETFLERKVPDYGGMTQSPVPGEIVSIFVSRKGNLRTLYEAIKSRITSRVSYSFLAINQIGEEDDLDFEPRMYSPEKFMADWINWRKTIVVGAAKQRIATVTSNTNKCNLMLRVIAKKREVLAVLDREKSDEAIDTKTAKLLSCSKQEAHDLLQQVNLRRLAKLEVAPLKEKIAANNRAITDNKKIVSDPRKRLLLDAEDTAKSIAASLEEAAHHQQIGRPSRARRPRV